MSPRLAPLRASVPPTRPTPVLTQERERRVASHCVTPCMWEDLDVRNERAKT